MLLKRVLRRLEGWESTSLKQAFLVAKNSIVLRKGPSNTHGQTKQQFVPWSSVGKRLEWPVAFLMEEECLALAQMGVITCKMLPTDCDIDRRGMSDWAQKLIAMCQTTWFAADITFQLSHGFQILLVEDMTAAYVLRAILTYICYLPCPKDVHEPWMVSLGDNEVQPCIADEDYNEEEAKFFRQTKSQDSYLRYWFWLPC